jgi:hypothetical protein
MSNQLSYKECENYQECKNTALERLGDAVALFDRERYTGAVYMAGYVIEIGTKAAFYKLANEEVSFEEGKFREIMEHLWETTPKKEVTNFFKTFSFPPRTPKDLLLFLKNIVLVSNSLKEFPQQVPGFSVIIHNRYPKQKEGYHDLKGFLDELQAWKNLLHDGQTDGRQPFDSGKYHLPDWDTKIRYSNDKTSARDALEAVKKAMNFIKEVLEVDDADKTKLVKMEDTLGLTSNKDERKTQTARDPLTSPTGNLPIVNKE